MQFVVWLAVGVVLSSQQGAVVLDPATFKTKEACEALQADAKAILDEEKDVVGFGQVCVPLTITKRDAPAVKPSDTPKLSTPKPGFEFKT